MASLQKSNGAPFNRGTGLLIMEVRCSNPNGDPDAESDPRLLDTDGRGLISPVSFKRKLRDLVGDHEGPVWLEAKKILKIDDQSRFDILEKRVSDDERDSIWDMDAENFTNKYWDARVFGNMFLEDIKGKGYEPGEKDHFIRTGVVQFGPGISIAPIEIERLTMTKKASVEKGKSRAMAPLGWRVVLHALYEMPFFINPMMAGKSGCNSLDIELMEFLIPHSYRNTASAIRPFVEIRNAWLAEHKSPLGSCPDSLILDALTPKKIKGDTEKPSTSIDDYEIPTRLPDDVRKRLENFEDLCLKHWN